MNNELKEALQALKDKGGKARQQRTLIMIGRRTGKQSAMRQQTVMRLLSGESVAFPGCKDPDAVIKGLGISCEAELMTVRKQSGEVVETGYLLTYKGD